MIIAIVGPQGCGKGTQAALLAEKYGWRNFSMGEALREIAKLDLPQSRRIAEFQRKGVLVPDEDIALALSTSIEPEDLKKGMILDGAPRNRQQLELIESSLKVGLDKAIYLDISQEESIRRLSGRLVCQKCGANFNTATQPPRKEGKCDRCSGELARRNDETPEAIRQRLQVYEQQTAPLLEIYRRRGILMEINGDRPIDQIHQDIVARLQEAGIVS